MGTNYYVIKKQPDEEIYKWFAEMLIHGKTSKSLCKKIHIGKKSGGWRFIFNKNNWEYYKNTEELKSFIKNNYLYNEYYKKVTSEDFWKMVEEAEKNPDSLDGKSYAERWDEIHPGEEKPNYMKEGKTGDESIFGYRFSKFSDFC